MPDCYTQEEIADKVGVDQTTIAKWVMIFRNIADFHNPPETTLVNLPKSPTTIDTRKEVAAQAVVRMR